MEKMVKISFSIPERLIRESYAEDSFTMKEAVRSLLDDMILDGLQACGKLDDFVKDLQIN